MILDRVKEIIAEHLNCSKDKLSARTSFTNNLNADSLDVFQIMMAVEAEFNIEVSNKDVEKIKTIEDIVTLVKQAKGLN
ncbi:acyl carrier protein [Candidatus Epulonipiscium fishelsonii]|uniref:Acyl carrier protein n=1 Tax=Candidatus Epulonipiscium fishelsonii TaxID=77094 RepID=A0ACC8XDY1_9FIRM|nr:acyl carrier protein [Epulopiscium sp. SCG-B05WGA-EpuloA1]ONI41055.1 acyl carrier protein [Epulopiscium sp. SCG-B11WGA-EpuloA1]ONI47933.1 acyl carrier protein [Epulopiscium sp. SCG-C06WGA-EpuloA1]